MPNCGRNQADSAGGTIIGEIANTVFVNNNVIAVVPDDVAPHGDGEHSSPVMNEGSSNVFACGHKVCRKGDKATCGHALSPGSSNVFVNGG
jgi:uncharacterized Zn-binding protein involved in type VI secretion